MKLKIFKISSIIILLIFIIISIKYINIKKKNLQNFILMTLEDPLFYSPDIYNSNISMASFNLEEKLFKGTYLKKSLASQNKKINFLPKFFLKSIKNIHYLQDQLFKKQTRQIALKLLKEYAKCIDCYKHEIKKVADFFIDLYSENKKIKNFTLQTLDSSNISFSDFVSDLKIIFYNASFLKKDLIKRQKIFSGAISYTPNSKKSKSKNSSIKNISKKSSITKKYELMNKKYLLNAYWLYYKNELKNFSYPTILKKSELSKLFVKGPYYININVLPFNEEVPIFGVFTKDPSISLPYPRLLMGHGYTINKNIYDNLLSYCNDQSVEINKIDWYMLEYFETKIKNLSFEDEIKKFENKNSKDDLIPLLTKACHEKSIFLKKVSLTNLQKLTNTMNKIYFMKKLKNPILHDLQMLETLKNKSKNFYLTLINLVNLKKSKIPFLEKIMENLNKSFPISRLTHRYTDLENPDFILNTSNLKNSKDAYIYIQTVSFINPSLYFMPWSKTVWKSNNKTSFFKKKIFKKNLTKNFIPFVPFSK